MDEQYFPQPQQQVQQLPISQDEIMATQLQEEKISNVLSQTSPDNQLMELQWRLKGYIFNAQEREWKKIDPSVEEPNAIMVSKYVSLVASLLNDNTRFSALQADEINKLMHTHIEWFVDDMDCNAEAYGIHRNYAERTRIGHILFNFMFTMLKRSQGGKEAQRIWGSLSLNESAVNNPQPRKKGMWETMRDWKI